MSCRDLTANVIAQGCAHALKQIFHVHTSVFMFSIMYEQTYYVPLYISRSEVTSVDLHSDASESNFSLFL